MRGGRGVTIPLHGANSTQGASVQPPAASSTRRNPCNRPGCPHGAWFDKITNRSRNQQDGVPPGTPEEHASVPIPLHGANSTQGEFDMPASQDPMKRIGCHNPLTRGELNSSHPRYSHPPPPAHVAIPATVPVAHTGRRPLTRTFLERKCAPRVAPRSPFRNHQDGVPPGTPEEHASVPIPLHGANSTQVGFRIQSRVSAGWRWRHNPLTRGVVRQAHQPFP